MFSFFNRWFRKECSEDNSDEPASMEYVLVESEGSDYIDESTLSAPNIENTKEQIDSLIQELNRELKNRSFFSYSCCFKIVSFFLTCGALGTGYIAYRTDTYIDEQKNPATWGMCGSEVSSALQGDCFAESIDSLIAILSEACKTYCIDLHKDYYLNEPLEVLGLSVSLVLLLASLYQGFKHRESTSGEYKLCIKKENLPLKFLSKDFQKKVETFLYHSNHRPLGLIKTVNELKDYCSNLGRQIQEEAFRLN